MKLLMFMNDVDVPWGLLVGMHLFTINQKCGKRIRKRECVSIFLTGSVSIIHENLKRNRTFYLKLGINPTTTTKKSRIQTRQNISLGYS